MQWYVVAAPGTKIESEHMIDQDSPHNQIHMQPTWCAMHLHWFGRLIIVGQLPFIPEVNRLSTFYFALSRHLRPCCVWIVARVTLLPGTHKPPSPASADNPRWHQAYASCTVCAACYELAQLFS